VTSTDIVRGSGLVAWWLLALDVLVGSILSGNLAAYTVMHGRKLIWHRWLGHVLAASVVTHVTVLVAGNVKGYRRLAAWGPTNGTLARNAGLVTLVMLAVVVVTSLAKVKKRIGRKWWARGHMLSLPILLVGTIHGLNAGPDANSFYVVVPGAAVLAFMVSAASSRIYRNWTRTRGNSGKRGRALDLIARPHGLHYQGPVTGEVKAAGAPRVLPTRKKAP